MDRLDAMRAFVTALDEGSLAAAGRRLGKSPAAMTRALAVLEGRVGTALIERTTRLLRATPAGERFAETARRILADLDAAVLDTGNAHTPGGLLTITAPDFAGTHILRPVIDAYLDAHPAVQVKLLLLDRPANLVEEGIDIALRIAHLPDSALVAMRVGSVRRVVCASPAYLAGNPPIRTPGDLSAHRIIALSDSRQADNWSFPSKRGRSGGTTIRLTPRFSVNSVRAARESAIDGKGVIRPLSYQIADAVHDGRLATVLAMFEPVPLPVHLIAPKQRLAIARTRTFADFALPRLREAFETATLPQS